MGTSRLDIAKDLVEAVRKRGNSVGTVKKDTSTATNTEHKVGDSVFGYAGGGKYIAGKVHRFGQTMIHIKPHRGGEAVAFSPKDVTKELPGAYDK